MNAKMSKNKIIILIITVIILASVLFYFWQNRSKLNGQGQTTENTESFPFGQDNNGGANSSVSTSANADGKDSSREEENLPILRRISERPVAGGISFENKDLITVIRYVDRGTGHIYETTEKSLEEMKISNTTIPKALQSIWSAGGQSVIIRYIKEGTEDISSFSANIITATTSQDVSKNPKSVFLPSNIEQLSVNPSGDKIFYLINDGAGGSAGVMSNIDGSQKKQVFQSPIKEWLVSWPNNEIIALATKPSSVAPGYLFFLNSQTGAENKILGGINGLTALTGSTTKNILYSESVDGSIGLNYYNSKNNQGGELSFKTLPEKCVWSRSEESVVYCAVPKAIIYGEYPDIWYQSLTSFTDSIWKIDIKTQSSELVLDIQQDTGNEIDVADPFLSKDDGYLFFINKKDLTFWSLSLKKTKINGSSPKNPSYF